MLRSLVLASIRDPIVLRSLKRSLALAVTVLPCGTVTDRLLDGVRVLELAEDLAGPYGGKLLADLGAEVVKVESKDGDPTRARGPFPAGRIDGAQSGLFHYLTGGKQLRRIDPAEPGARE